MALQLHSPFAVMPAELIIEMMREMGCRDLTAFALANRRLFLIFKANQHAIMTAVLLRQPELEQMLLIFTIDKSDFYRNAMLHPRTINYHKGRDSSEPVELMKSSVAFREGKLICPRKIDLGPARLAVLWNSIKIIDWWVEEYPKLRWYKNPEDRRCLRRSEELRLRKAISRWWLYAECFHGDWVYYNMMPKMWQIDNRLHHLRLMSTIEIRELEDLWETVRATVQRDICSSVEPGVSVASEWPTHDAPEFVANFYQYGWKRVPWGVEDWRSKSIVNTYLKLDPEQLKYLLEFVPRSNKAAVIRLAKDFRQEFDSQQETLSWSMDVVLQERFLLSNSENLTSIPSSGITDEDCFNDKDRTFRSDAWPTGKPPLTKQEVDSFPTWHQKHIPHGDDGHDLDY